MKIKLEIKAADFEDSSYYNSSDCAISRALKRAGYPNLKDAGVDIWDINMMVKVVESGNPAYDAMSDKVDNMYLNPSTREDFEVELDIDY